MVQISEKVCKKALEAVMMERIMQNISDVCATEQRTALAGNVASQWLEWQTSLTSRLFFLEDEWLYGVE
ncbi:hypothetical protein FOCG_06271 [Fusarium oxysporum f. sp. radicis-lycopersici 26381]|nr:hypothetical protein FOCG_06271 [Fusarium oxysporum f. sp. radicis-lycopersici 26381]